MRFAINPFTGKFDAYEENAPGAVDIETITGNGGGGVTADGSHNVNIFGAGGITVTGTPLTNTLTITAAGSGITWSRDVLAAVALTADSGHVPTNVGLTTYTLPAVAALGTVVEIAGESAGLWRIAQNAGQNIQIGNVSTTVGVGGSITATNRYDSISIVCRVANTTWQCISAPMGALNMV